MHFARLPGIFSRGVYGNQSPAELRCFESFRSRFGTLRSRTGLRASAIGRKKSPEARAVAAAIAPERGKSARGARS